MLNEVVAERYASALFALAQDKSSVNLIAEELASVQQTLDQHAPLARALQAPNVPDTVKKDILRKLFASSVSPAILSFLFILVDNKREAYVGTIARAYQGLMDKAANIEHAEVETAVNLPANVKNTFTAKLSEREGKKIVIDWKVNPELVGGFVIRIGDRLIDASLAARLEELRIRLEGPVASFVEKVG
ncbi:MAG: F0F1 ATP synthase subunit delta [Candidatus Xenobia bacterium]